MTQKNTACPTWLNFLNKTTGNNSESIDTLRKFMARCLDPKKRCDHALVLAGQGVGKSTIRKVLTCLIPIGSTSRVSLSEIETAHFRYKLKGSWFNHSCITSPNDLDTSSHFKSIIDGDPILARQLYQHPIQFIPYCKLLFETPAPSFKHRRCHCITFDYHPTLTNPDLFVTLLEETDGIRAWADHWQAQ